MTSKRNINPIVGYVWFNEVEVIKDVIRIHAVAVRFRKLGKNMRMKKLLDDLKKEKLK